MKYKIVIEERSHDSLSRFAWWHTALRILTVLLMGGVIPLTFGIVRGKITPDDPFLLLYAVMAVLWFGYQVRVRIERKSTSEKPTEDT